VNADKTGLHTIFQCTGLDCDISDGPTWSPDGATIAFATYGAAAIHLVPSAGGPVRDVPTCVDTACVVPRDLVWSPDGRSLALVGNTDYTDPSRVYVVTANGGGTRLVGGDFYCCLAWLPR
jgi:Tol biopolymer transport system component